MRELFTVPEGKKVTEKMFGRVLLSSVCSILLCAACLISTTWAWFAVSIENTGNEIVIASVTPTVTITATEGAATEVSNGGYTLTKGAYSVNVNFTKEVTEQDGFGVKTGPVYLLMSVIRADDTPESYYVEVKNDCDHVTCALAIGDASVKISFSVVWVPPAASEPIVDNVTIGEISTALTEPPAQATTQAATEASTEASTEATTEPTTESTTEAITDTVSSEPSSEPTNEATEPETTASTEETTGTTEGES